MTVEILTAETDEGKRAIEEVMRLSYTADIDCVPPQWVRVRFVDGVPVSFIVVDPDREMDFPYGGLRFAFVNDIATREDRRGEGHFRAILEDTLSSLEAAGFSIVLLHGESKLYRRFGFDVFTHHRGIFITPDDIERALGRGINNGDERLLVVEDREPIQKDLLLVTEVNAEAIPDCRRALLAAAALGKRLGKTRILFEHPAAPSHGSRYPIHATLETPFSNLARTCGAQVITQGADPEGGAVKHADWIKVLEPVRFLEDALRCSAKPSAIPPATAVSFETEVGSVTVESSGEDVVISNGTGVSPNLVRWPSSALAQLATGYRSAEVLAAIHQTALPAQVISLLDTLFPTKWRLSRNESWVY